MEGRLVVLTDNQNYLRSCRFHVACRNISTEAVSSRYGGAVGGSHISVQKSWHKRYLVFKSYKRYLLISTFYSVVSEARYCIWCLFLVHHLFSEREWDIDFEAVPVLRIKFSLYMYMTLLHISQENLAAFLIHFKCIFVNCYGENFTFENTPILGKTIVQFQSLHYMTICVHCL